MTQIKIIYILYPFLDTFKPNFSACKKE